MAVKVNNKLSQPRSNHFETGNMDQKNEAGVFLASPGLGSLKPPQEDKISKTKNAGMIFFKILSKFDIFFINA